MEHSRGATGGDTGGGDVDEDVAAEQQTVDTAAADSLAIRARKLRKVFPPAESGGCAKPEEKPKETVAVKGLSLGVRPNECLGLLGPNGAGKTTTISVLTTTLIATSGTVRVCGCDVDTDPTGVRRNSGLIFQN